MGLRGRHAFTHRRAPSKNALANAAYRDDLREGSHGYWDLLLGSTAPGGRYWPDQFDPAREAAWAKWRDRIRQRWPYGWSRGSRPDAWRSFDLPLLIVKAWEAGTLTEKQVGAMSVVELVHRLDANAAERRDIEEAWARHLEFGRKHARNLGVPSWFPKSIPAIVTRQTNARAR